MIPFIPVCRAFVVLGALSLPPPCILSSPETPALRIESFGPTRAYAVGTQSLLMVGTVRNVGRTALPANTVTARIYCLSGLDYAEGDTGPKLPALEPNAAATFRWKVSPTGPDAALVASLVLEGAGVPPTARVVAIQHFADPPGAGSGSVVKQPVARVRSEEAVLENAKVRARIVVSDSEVPVLFLSARTAGGWRQVGVSLPLAEALSAEGGQQPWWEVFKGEEAQAVNGKGEASLSLTGSFGLRWRATLDFMLRADSAALDVRLRLSPLRPMKLSGVRLCPFLVGEGSFGAAVSEMLAPTDSGPNTVAAVRWGEVTMGMLWPNAPLFTDWETVPLPGIEGADYRILGAEMRAGGIPPVSLAPGALVEARGRLFALTPSKTVQDARRVALPIKK